MNYCEVTFSCQPNEETVKDILCSLLGEIGFESFSENEESNICAYIQEELFNEENINQVIRDFPMDASISFSSQVIITRNWNEEWEKHYFQPIIIGSECAIHSSFHQNIPPVKYDIVIDPKMSFGTGHHETTGLIIGFLLQEELAGKSLLDMGCGTSVLAILASMKGAGPVTAIDNDEWAYNNSLENIRLNRMEEIQVQLGDASLLGKEKFDIILANINRNSLLRDIPAYAQCMHLDSDLYMSGFYTEDIPAIREVCEKNELAFRTFRSNNNWAAVKFTKTGN